MSGGKKKLSRRKVQRSMRQRRKASDRKQDTMRDCRRAHGKGVSG